MAAMAAEAWAKRGPPEPVTPVVHNGVKYVAPNQNGREGRVEARDAKSDKLLWGVTVYTVPIDPNLEEDVQWVFIAGLALRDGALLVTNEKNQQFVLDLKTKEVKKVEKDGR
jgi:acyl-CoA hydrolase